MWTDLFPRLVLLPTNPSAWMSYSLSLEGSYLSGTWQRADDTLDWVIGGEVKWNKSPIHTGGGYPLGERSAVGLRTKDKRAAVSPGPMGAEMKRGF